MPLRVFVVDDHENLRLLFDVCLDLEDDMQLVGTAGDGLEAVRLALELRPDAIVLDCDLPLRHGMDVLPVLRDMLPEAAVIMFSATGDPAVVAEAVSLGARGYLVKDRHGVADVLSLLRSSTSHALSA